MACAAVLLHSCEDVETHKPYGDGSGHAPGTVQVTSYEQIPGGVTLKFIAPTDEDLLYIKIKYLYNFLYSLANSFNSLTISSHLYSV